MGSQNYFQTSTRLTVLCLLIIPLLHVNAQITGNSGQLLPAQRVFAPEARNRLREEVQLAGNRRVASQRLRPLDMRNSRRDSGDRSLRIQVRGNENDFVNATNANIQVQGTTMLLSRSNPRRVVNLQARDFDRSGAPGSTARQAVGPLQPDDCIFDQANNQACDTTTFFREPSGRCNNLNDKTWGMAGTAFRRARSAVYEDVFAEERETELTTGNTLPNPRAISTAVTRTNVILDTLGFSMQLMQWGQFIAHEVTAIRESELDAICCPDQLFAAENPGVTPTAAQLNEARARIEDLRGDICIAIERFNDPVYNKDVCMSQVRATAAPLADCSPSPRQQMNTATHFVDGSAIYGSSTAAHTRLRSFNDGKLKAQMIGGVELPPRNPELSCPSAPRCPFDAGDRRINTTPNLASTHTLFLRKHNQIATGLKARHSGWNDERLFQESRRIVIAIQQNIHYNEWLQILLGSKLDEYNLRKSNTNNFRNLYKSNLHPGLLNELATAGLRFGHTTVGGRFTVGNGFFDLTEHFEDPELVYTRGTGQCLAGLAGDRPWKFDRFFTEPMRDSLFDSDLDIIALNLNRGRDHGLGSYVQYRQNYGLTVPSNFDDMEDTHPVEVVTALRDIYTDVRDVELYIGGVTENKLPNGYIGPLFAEILGDGFERLRDGDRFYFEGQGSGFTRDQLNSIRRYTYAKLICEHGGVSSIPRDAFRRRASGSNPTVNCESLPDVDLDLWGGDTGLTTTTESPQQCYWSIVSQTECCRGQKTVTRECKGDRYCRPGSTGCPGSTTVTERCSCGYDNRCTRGDYCTPTTTTYRPPSCSWRTTSTGDCCRGRKEITRRCEGGYNCRPGSNGCSGSTVTYERCSCPFYDRNCLSGCGGTVTTTRRPRPARCYWRNISTSQCCLGRQTVSRRCEGGPYCRAGSSGCLGSTTVSQSCSNRRSCRPRIPRPTLRPVCYNGRCIG